MRNSEISEGYYIATVAIESNLKYYRLNVYYRLNQSLSTAYLNGKEYFIHDLQTLDNYIIELKEAIKDNIEKLKKELRNNNTHTNKMEETELNGLIK